MTRDADFQIDDRVDSYLKASDRKKKKGRGA